MIRLATMGSNLAHNLVHHGNTVALFNRRYPCTKKLMNKHGTEGNFVPAETLEKFATSLKRPRTAIIMVKAGAPTDATIAQLEEVFEPGDITVNGSNSFFEDTIKREEEVHAKDFHFIGYDVSGGEKDTLSGLSLILGDTTESWKTLGPILQSTVVKVNGESCVTHIGADGAGHFVKMIHNDIECADMQVVGKAHDILHRGFDMDTEKIGNVFAERNKGDLDSYLIKITVEILYHRDAETGKPFVDVVVNHASMKGTSMWTVQTGLRCGSSVAAIGEAVFARALSSHGELREDTQREGLAGPNKAIDPAEEDKAAFVENVRRVLFAPKVVAYAQGLNEVQDGAKEYGWDVNPSEVARIWRGGCIIRTQFLLDRITEVFRGDNPPASLLFDPYFEKIIGELQDAWHRVIVRTVGAGILTPVFSNSLTYCSGLRSKRLPTALTQSRRDLFGAHTCGHVDKSDVFHTLWAEEGKPEIET